MELTFCDIRTKNVINTLNGKCLGRPIDLVYNTNNANVLGIVVPGCNKLFHTKENIFIPWCNISKFGDDTILVTLPELCSG